MLAKLYCRGFVFAIVFLLFPNVQSVSVFYSYCLSALVYVLFKKIT